MRFCIFDRFLGFVTFSVWDYIFRVKGIDLVLSVLFKGYGDWSIFILVFLVCRVKVVLRRRYFKIFLVVFIEK